MRDDDPRVTYRWLREVLEADPFFPAEALAVLRDCDPGSTYTLATSAGALLNRWTVERDLAVYERGLVVKDVTDVMLYADENGGFGAADERVERDWKIAAGYLPMDGGFAI